MSVYDITEKIEKKYGFKGELVHFFTITDPWRKTKFCKAIRELGHDIDYIIEMRKQKKLSDKDLEKIDRRIFRNHYIIEKIVADIIGTWSKPWLERDGGSPVKTGGEEVKLAFYGHRPDVRLAHVKEEDYEAIIEKAIMFDNLYKTAYVAIPDAVRCETAFVDIFLIG